jgi:hypothetical protein
MAKTETLNIDLLVIDADTQARVSIHADTVDEYAELITNNKDWPFDLLDVFHDGNNYLVADGFHRTLAAQRSDVKSVPCRVHKGTAKDARIFGMTANDQHGLRMSRADKRHCVEWLLDNGGKLTQLEIGVTAGVSKRTVAYIVAERKAQKVQIALSDSQNIGKTPKPTSIDVPVRKNGSPSPPISGGSGPCEETETSGEAAECHGDQVPPDEEPNGQEQDATPAAPNTASIVLDTLDREIPAKFRAAHELSVTLMSIGRELDKYRQRAKELSEQPGGEWLQMQLIDTEVRGLKARFQDAIYHTVCLQCAGKGCQKCQQNGWLPDFMKGMI